MVCIDYEPVSVNYTRLAEKQLIEMMNFIPLSGCEINLSSIEMRAILGVDELSKQLTQHIAQDLYGTKGFRLLLGLMPVRSLYNVGSGAVDLFVLPIQQYQKDGNILRGIRQGVTSFVSNASVESVSLGASTMSGLYYAIDTVRGFFSYGSSPNPDATPVQQPQPSVPTNLTEGMQKACNDLNENYHDAKYAVLAVPTDGTTVGALRAVPLVVLSPFAGLTSAASSLLSGVEATFRPKDDDVYKNYSMQ